MDTLIQYALQTIPTNQQIIRHPEIYEFYYKDHYHQQDFSMLKNFFCGKSMYIVQYVLKLERSFIFENFIFEI